LEGADLLGELVLDSAPLAVALDQVLSGQLLAVGEQQRRLVAADAAGGELAAGMAGESDWVFVVGGSLVLAGAVEPGLGPGAGGQLLQRGDPASGSAGAGLVNPTPSSSTSARC
jgi:hypothetical protein